MSGKLPVSVLVVVHTAALDVLAAAADYWAGRGRPFFAVFIDPGHALALPELFRRKCA